MCYVLLYLYHVFYVCIYMIITRYLELCQWYYNTYIRWKFPAYKYQCNVVVNRKWTPRMFPSPPYQVCIIKFNRLFIVILDLTILVGLHDRRVYIYYAIIAFVCVHDQYVVISTDQNSIDRGRSPSSIHYRLNNRDGIYYYRV